MISQIILLLIRLLMIKIIICRFGSYKNFFIIFRHGLTESTKKPLFDGDFEAWIHGPVNREIYNRFASTKNIYSEIEMNDCINKDVKIDNDDAEFIDWILKNYAKFSGFELEKLSHSEIPWIKTRDMLDPHERCDKVISPDFIQEYYGEKWKKIK